QTLDIPDIREKVIEFYEKYYCASVMKLVVYSNKTIEDLKKIITRIFSAIPKVLVKEKKKNKKEEKKKNKKEEKNTNPSKDICYDLPFSDLPKLIKMVPIMRENRLIIIWQLTGEISEDENEDENELYKYGPLDFLAYLLGGEYKGS